MYEHENKRISGREFLILLGMLGSLYASGHVLVPPGFKLLAELMAHVSAWELEKQLSQVQELPPHMQAVASILAIVCSGSALCLALLEQHVHEEEYD
jgi:hypothetical protein